MLQWYSPQSGVHACSPWDDNGGKNEVKSDDTLNLILNGSGRVFWTWNKFRRPMLKINMSGFPGDFDRITGLTMVMYVSGLGPGGNGEQTYFQQINPQCSFASPNDTQASNFNSSQCDWLQMRAGPGWDWISFGGDVLVDYESFRTGPTQTGLWSTSLDPNMAVRANDDHGKILLIRLKILNENPPNIAPNDYIEDILFYPPSDDTFYPHIVVEYSADVSGSTDLFIGGQIGEEATEISTSGDLFINGHDQISSSGDLFIQGHDAITASGDLFIHGQDTTSGSFDLFIDSHIIIVSSDDLFIHGHNDITKSIDLFIDGLDSVETSGDLFIHGQDGVSGSIDLFINGHEDVNTSVDLFISGRDTFTTSGDLFVQGHNLVSGSHDLFIHGITSHTASGDLFIQGISSITISGEIPLFIDGHNVVSGLHDLFINGHIDHTASIDLFIGGISSVSNSGDLFINGHDDVNASADLFIGGKDSTSTSGDLFIHGYDQTSGSHDIFIQGHENTSGSTDLFINGQDAIVASIDLFIHGLTDHNDSNDLFIDGVGFDTNSFDLFTTGSGIIDFAISLNLFINGFEHKPAVVCPILDPTVSIQIPDSMIMVYQSSIDGLINQLGKNVLLEFDPTIESCPNCEYDIVNKKSIGVYTPGGPRPFTRGRQCPYCKGIGVLETKSQKCIKCLIKWHPRELEDFGISIEQRDNIVRLKTYITYVDDLMKAESAIVSESSVDITELTVVLIRNPIPVGLREDKYCISFWKIK